MAIKRWQLDVGTGPNQIVALDEQGRLPAIDGSQLRNLPLSRDIDFHKEEIVQRLLQSEEEIRERILAELQKPTPPVVPTEVEPEVVEIELTLEEVKDEALYTIDALAENARQEYLGVGPAQMMVYNEKFNEASDYLVDDMPEDVSKYPFINAEVGATGKSAEQVANDIIDEKGKWISFNAKVERVRLAAKTHIKEAQTVESIDNIVETAAEHIDLMVK